ncbi:MAG TPA: hypothetical protein DC049_12675 [Spirochaetia bacterium]|nr:hypothetical protein [Spirochaetia bacterium]
MQLENYISQISRETGAVININISRHPAFSHMSSLKLPPDLLVHSGKLCVWARRDKNIRICRQNKARSLQVASRGREFCGTCPWGIWELVIPVKFFDHYEIVIYLGYFLQPDSTVKYLNDKEYPGPLPPVITPEKIKRLRHYGRFLSQFIKLELENYTEEKKSTAKQQPEEYYSICCQNYINEKYQENISLCDLAKKLKVNSNYLGGLLKKDSGKTFRELLLTKRLYIATLYLAMHGDLNISRIAFKCGFDDSNYFCKVFSREFGLSPRQYRLRHYTTMADKIIKIQKGL